MNRILTWSKDSNNGAFQKLVNGKVFSDLIEVKPNFSFAFVEFKYYEQGGVYTIDGEEMTPAQKAEIVSYIDAVIPPLSWNITIKTNEIGGKHETLVSELIGSVSSAELATWRKQEEQARAWKADNNIATPMIDGILLGRGSDYTKDQYIDKIIANATKYENEYSKILGKYLLKMKEISLATTASEVDAITWGV